MAVKVDQRRTTKFTYQKVAGQDFKVATDLARFLKNKRLYSEFIREVAKYRFKRDTYSIWMAFDHKKTKRGQEFWLGMAMQEESLFGVRQEECEC